MNPTTYRDDLGKVCTKCLEYKMLSEYYRIKTTKDGLNSWCKACMKACSNGGDNSARAKKSRSNKAESLRTYTDRIYYNYHVSKKEAARLSKIDHCENCGAPLGEGGRFRHVDHSYVTGKVRGVLCAQCNTGLGKLGDSASAVERVGIYLVGSVDALDMATQGQTYLPDYI